MLRGHQATGAGGPPGIDDTRHLFSWRGNGRAATMLRGHQATGAGGPPKNGGATASLPLCPARIRPPRPAALQRMEGQRPRCPCAPHASGRRGRQPSKVWRGSGLVALVPRTHQAAAAGGPPKNGGAAASLPLCPARIRPPWPAALPSRRTQSEGIVAYFRGFWYTRCVSSSLLV